MLWILYPKLEAFRRREYFAVIRKRGTLKPPKEFTYGSWAKAHPILLLEHLEDCRGLITYRSNFNQILSCKWYIYYVGTYRHIQNNFSTFFGLRNTSSRQKSSPNRWVESRLSSFFSSRKTWRELFMSLKRQYANKVPGSYSECLCACAHISLIS